MRRTTLARRCRSCGIWTKASGLQARGPGVILPEDSETEDSEPEHPQPECTEPDRAPRFEGARSGPNVIRTSVGA